MPPPFPVMPLKQVPIRQTTCGPSAAIIPPWLCYRRTNDRKGDRSPNGRLLDKPQPHKTKVTKPPRSNTHPLFHCSGFSTPVLCFRHFDSLSRGQGFRAIICTRGIESGPRQVTAQKRKCMPRMEDFVIIHTYMYVHTMLCVSLLGSPGIGWFWAVSAGWPCVPRQGQRILRRPEKLEPRMR